jgi:hypothetical protein
MRLDIKTSIIIALVIAIFCLTTCNSCQQKNYEKKIAKLEADCSGENKSEKKSDTTYNIDSVTVILGGSIPIEVKKPEKEIVWKFDTLYVEGEVVDNHELAEDYFSERAYADTTHLQYGYVVTSESISENRRKSFSIKPVIIVPTITNTNTITKTEYRSALYLGIDGFWNKNGLHSAGVSAMFKT